MKNTILILIAALLIGLSSCEKETPKPPIIEEEDPVTDTIRHIKTSETIIPNDGNKYMSEYFYTDDGKPERIEMKEYSQDNVLKQEGAYMFSYNADGNREKIEVLTSTGTTRVVSEYKYYDGYYELIQYDINAQDWIVKSTNYFDEKNRVIETEESSAYETLKKYYTWEGYNFVHFKQEIIRNGDTTHYDIVPFYKYYINPLRESRAYDNMIYSYNVSNQYLFEVIASDNKYPLTIEFQGGIQHIYTYYD